MAAPDLGCWLYASRCALPGDWAARAVEHIVATSLGRNAERGVTGALLFTGTHFVQFLEASPPDLATLRHSIAADARHHTIRTLMEGPCPRRRFADWSLAYAGPSLFVADQVQALLDGQGDAVGSMMVLLREFTRPR